MLSPFFRSLGMFIASVSFICLIIGILGYTGRVGRPEPFFADPSCAVSGRGAVLGALCQRVSGTITSATKVVGRKGSWHIVLGVRSPRGQESVALQSYVGAVLLTAGAGVYQPVTLQIYEGFPIRVYTTNGSWQTKRFPLTPQQKAALVVICSCSGLVIGLMWWFGKARRR